jgi:hypothetical protein
LGFDFLARQALFIAERLYKVDVIYKVKYEERQKRYRGKEKNHYDMAGSGRVHWIGLCCKQAI